MNEPREPERPQEPGISLPSWVDDAISKSRTGSGSEPNPVSDAGPAAELAVNPPPVESPSLSPSPSAEAARAPETPQPAPSEATPEDGRKVATLPGVALALLFLGAALLVGYLLLTRTPRP
jgi:hypothetical protein